MPPKKYQSGKVIAAFCGSSDATTSDHRCCAERNLLDGALEDARRHGVRPMARIAWVRRKRGKDVTISRPSDVAVSSFPCIVCAARLILMDMRVHATLSDGAWFHGYLTDPDAPVSKPIGSDFRSWALRDV